LRSRSQLPTGAGRLARATVGKRVALAAVRHRGTGVSLCD
jgi:hypothetical protein